MQLNRAIPRTPLTTLWYIDSGGISISMFREDGYDGRLPEIGSFQGIVLPDRILRVVDNDVTNFTGPAVYADRAEAVAALMDIYRHRIAEVEAKIERLNASKS